MFTFNPVTTKPAVCNNTAPGDTCTVECKEGFTVVDPFSGDRQSKVSVSCNGGGGWDFVFCQKGEQQSHQQRRTNSAVACFVYR
jgi:hypothetical protein